MPTVSRCYEFGRAVGRALANWNEEIRIAIIGSGGLSHSPPLPSIDDVEPEDEEFERLVHGHQYVEADAWDREQRLLKGYAKFKDFINSDWDIAFLEDFTSGRRNELAKRLDDNVDEFIQTAGPGGHEVRTWFATAGAVSDQKPDLWEIGGYEPIPSLITGMGIAYQI